MTRRQSIVLAGILLAALVLRLGWGLSRPADEASLAALPDQLEYLQAARQWTAGHDWRFHDPRVGQWVYASRTPEYPLLIACCRGSVQAVRVAQAILDTSTALAAYLLARQLGLKRAALMAAALVAFNPFLIYFSSLLLTETLFTALVAWGVVLLLRNRLLAGAALVALAALARPAGMALPTILAAAAAWSTGRSIWRVAGWAAAAAALSILVLLPWAIRNHRVLGAWIWTTTNGGITAWDGLQPGATGASDQRFVKSMPELRRMDEVARDEYFRRLSADAATSSPLRVIRLAVPKIARTWSPIPLSDTFGRPLYQAVAAVYAIPLLVLAVGGLVRGLGASSRLLRRQTLVLLLPMLWLTLVHALSVGSLRYRMPLEPLLAVAAALGVAALPPRGAERGR